MENTEISKAAEEIVTTNNKESNLPASGIVISEKGGVAPNASAFGQRFIQNCETNAVLDAKGDSEIITELGKLAGDDPMLRALVIEKYDKIDERRNKRSNLKTICRTLGIVGGLSVLGVGVGLGLSAGNSSNDFRTHYLPSLSEESEVNPDPEDSENDN